MKVLPLSREHISASIQNQQVDWTSCVWSHLMIYLPFSCCQIEMKTGPCYSGRWKRLLPIGLYIVILCPRCFFPTAPNQTSKKTLPTSKRWSIKLQGTVNLNQQIPTLRDQLRNRWDVKIPPICRWYSRWWFQIFFIFTPILGEDSHFD